MPDVSIIVPMYNARETIARCLDSLCAQTLPDIEMIVVDDGSTDGGPVVVREYERKDQRIRLACRRQGGAGAARNAGLALAQGRYVLFVDSDDWLEQDAVQELVAAGDSTAADIVMYGAVHEFGGRTQAKDEFLFADRQIVERGQFRQAVYPLLLGGDRLNSPWGKLYRLDMLTDNTILFDTSLRVAEDLLFNAGAFTFGRRLVAVNARFYHYWRGGAGLTSTPGMAKIIPYRDCCLRLFAYLKAWGMDTRQNRELLAARISVHTARIMFEAFRPSGPGFWEKLRLVRIVFSDSTIHSMSKNARLTGRGPRSLAELVIMKTRSLLLAALYGEALNAYRAVYKPGQGLKA
jgi:glycosyltransferase involved in cell wall biosynthesis